MMGTSRVIFMVFIGVALGSSVYREDSNNIKLPYDNIRLPVDIVPIKYRIYLHPNVTDGKFQFTGNVEILLEVKNPTDTIIIHSKSLVHLYTKIYEHGNEDMVISVRETRTHEKHEMVMLQLNTILSVKKRYVIYIIFVGNLSGGLRGFYKSSYKTKKGETR